MVQVLVFIAVSIIVTTSVMTMNINARESAAQLYRDTNLEIASDQHWAADRYTISSKGGIEALLTLSGVTSGGSGAIRVPASSFPELEMEKEVTINGKVYTLKKVVYLNTFPDSPNKVDFLLIENDYYDGEKLVFSKPRVLSK